MRARPLKVSTVGVVDRHDEPGSAHPQQRAFRRNQQTHPDPVTLIHDTAPQAAPRGTRFHDFPDAGPAPKDALRLAEVITSPTLAAALPLRDGKAAVIDDPHRIGSSGLLRAYGRIVLDSPDGRCSTTCVGEPRRVSTGEAADSIVRFTVDHPTR